MTTKEPQAAQKAKYLYVVQLDIPPEKEPEFNDLYDNEHFSGLLKVSGVLGGARYITDEPGEIKYLALYELESPEVRESDEWRKTSDGGLWPSRVRPHITRRSRVLYRRIYPEQ